MRKIVPNKFKKGRNTLERVSNKGIKSLENNFNVKATKKIINTPKIVNEKPQVVAKPRVVTSSKIASKLKKAIKPKIVDKSEIVIEKKYPNYGEYKNRVIKQLKHFFNTKKSGYLDDEEEECKGIRDLEYLLEDVNEEDEDYYKPERVKNAFKSDNEDYNYRVYKSRGS